jgi:microcystin-dependent protein
MGGGASAWVGGGGTATSAAGSGTAANVVQPTIVLNYIIKA